MPDNSHNNSRYASGYDYGFCATFVGACIRLPAWRSCKNCWCFALIEFPMVRMQRQDSWITCSGRQFLNRASFKVVSTNDYQNARVVDIGKIQFHQCPPMSTRRYFRHYQWRFMNPWKSVSRDELQTVPFAGVVTTRAEGTVSISCD